MRVNIKDVIVKTRFRKDLGDMKGFKENIKSLGLLQPILITKDNVLVDGQRRLLACTELGHDEIEARVFDVSSIIEGEIAGNVFRKNYTVSERVAIAKYIEDEIGERRGGDHGNQYTGKAHKVAGCQNEHSGEETRAIAARKAGFGSHETCRRATVIVEKGTPEQIEKVDSEKISIGRAFKEIDLAEKKAKLDKRMKEAAKHYKADESIQIVNDDFYPWCTENLQNDSVDLILTDPPYPKEFLYVWGQLGEVAARVLKPGGYLATYSGQLYFNQVMRALDEHLSYMWTIGLQHKCATQYVGARGLVCGWKPILIYKKGKPGKIVSASGSALMDFIGDDYREKGFHEWGQGENAVAYLMKTLSQPGDMVLDPFVGGGTTLAVAKEMKRKCIGIEMDAQYMDAIKSRCA